MVRFFSYVLLYKNKRVSEKWVKLLPWSGTLGKWSVFNCMLAVTTALYFKLGSFAAVLSFSRPWRIYCRRSSFCLKQYSINLKECFTQLIMHYPN